MLNHRDYLAAHKRDEIIALANDYFSTTDIYQKLQLKKEGISKRTLENFMASVAEEIRSTARRKSVRKTKYTKPEPGQKYNHWTLVKSIGYKLRNSSGYAPKRSLETKSTCYWLCRCDCGKEKMVNVSNVISGKSMGCCGNKKSKNGEVKDE